MRPEAQHHVNPAGPWRTPLNAFNIALRAFPQARCGDSFLDRIHVVRLDVESIFTGKRLTVPSDSA